MKNLIYILIFIFNVNTLLAQLNPEPKKITERFFPNDETVKEVTPTLQKKRGFTDYQELIFFLEMQQQKHPELVELKYIGKSQKGYDIPIIYISNDNYDSDNKVKVWYQGALHGNEMATADSMMYIIYKMLNDDSLSYLLEKIDLAIVPMANIDGFLKVDRYSANGLDLNRDQTKLMAPESVILKNTFNEFKPQVALDFHEYNPYRRDFSKLSDFGITSAFDAMFLYSSNPNIPQSVRDLTDHVFVENARKELDENNYTRHRDYVSTGDLHGEIIFKSGGSSARSSSTSFSLANTVAAVIETRGIRLGRTSFKRRMKVASIIGISFLKTTYKEIKQLKSTLASSRETEKTVAVKTKKKYYDDTIPAIDIDTYKLIDLPVTIRDAKGMKVTLKRDKPNAYILSKELGYLVDKLRILGLDVSTLDNDESLEVEAYKVIEYDRDETKYEKMNLQNVQTKTQTKTIVFPKGSYKVDVNQKNAGYLYEVLEPERPNSFVSFGVLETSLNEELPIYRFTSKK